ncbi:MAG: maltose Oacetyltransferase [Symbiobacteriaceae bacterium]|jgi:maltose O-acetyltransferase|nr:maltose Oacetyltransferase [Symbiobacteriaceae bacterium]
MKTELQKMLAGELYNAADPELVELRNRARRLARAFNATTELELERRSEILSEWFGAVGSAYIEPPFQCDYGGHVRVGKNFYMNFNCIILDSALVEIGDNVACAPGVQILTAHHPVRAAERILGPELASPIKIGNNVWIGAGAIICPGVTIGDNTTIGAGSVVTKDIPANVVAAGNPCRVIRTIE